jgi:hypothetical protein
MTPRARVALILAFASVPAAALAQSTFDGTQALDAYTGPVVTEGRIVGLAGAFVAVAEGIGGAAVNPAAVAHRRRDLDRTWDLGGTLTWYIPAVAEVGRTDLGNDGRSDGNLTSVQNLQIGGMLQLGSLGVGLIANAWQRAVNGGAGTAVYAGTADFAIVGGWASPRETLVLGAALTVGSGEVGWYPAGRPRPANPPAVHYSGSRLRLGALLRPRGEPWRMGIALDRGALAEPTDPREGFAVPTPARFEFPWTLSLGASRWFGPNARHYNEPAQVAVWMHPEWGAPPDLQPVSGRPVLVTAQVDLVGATPGAVTIESALRPGQPVAASGGKPAVALRAGAEWEAWSRVLRGRVGSYLEPSRSGAGHRVHGTFGLDVRVPFWPWDLQLAVAGDAARLYRNVSLSLGFWSEKGPLPPARW